VNGQVRITYGDDQDLVGPFDVGDRELYAFHTGFLCGRLSERHPDYDPGRVQFEIIVDGKD